MSLLLRNQNKFLRSSGAAMALKLNSPAHYRRYLSLRYHQHQLLPIPVKTQPLSNQGSLSQLKENYESGNFPLSVSILPPPSIYLQQFRMRPQMRPYCYSTIRHFKLGRSLYDNPSSKVEETVQTMKKQQKEKSDEILKEATAASATATKTAADTAAASTTAPIDKASSSSGAQSTHKSTFKSAQISESTDLPSAKAQDFKPVVVKKPLKTRIWEEIVHYYHGFRLLFIDINICRKLLWRVLNGKTLTRRENNLLVRTTSDLFRLIPFSVFIIVPFMELLLPVFIKFFPGMLPSTFQTSKEREDKLKQSLQVKLEMAKFLQKTLDEMAVQHKDHKSEEAKQFVNFFHRIKNPNEYVSKEELIKYASRFKDEITLDSLSREQLTALCRLLEINTMGTTSFLRFQLRVKLRSLAADDRVIAREGVKSLDLYELQNACKARGMRAYGLTSERLHTQLQEWIDLSLNEKVPPTLLLLSRAMFISDEHTTEEKLKETIRVLPDSVAAQTKASIGELEGKIDNLAKIEVIKEEERKIKEEQDEEREEQKAKDAAAAEELIDKAPNIVTDTPMDTIEGAKASAALSEAIDDKTLSSKDVELLSEALKSLSSDKKKMIVEKEQIKEIKEELEDYKEDVEELREVRNVVQEPVQESRAAKLLFKKVNKMLGQLDKVLDDLEKKQQEIQQGPEPSPEEALLLKRKQEMVHITELMQAIKTVQNTSTESRLKQIENVLSKLDSDKDGVVTVDEVLKVIEAIGRENIQLDEKLLGEVITLLDKEQLIVAEEKIEKALAKSIKEAEMIKAKKQRLEQRRIASEQAFYEELKDKAPQLFDNASDVELDEKAKFRLHDDDDQQPNMPGQKPIPKPGSPPCPTTTSIPASTLQHSRASTPAQPTPPPNTSSSTTNPKDKLL